MLTIGQLAAYVRVTVRAIRHYHQRGLLAEPARDASGYRRYDADAVIALIRIKTLADAGVPLARIEELLSAGPEEFSRAIAQIDQALMRRIRDLQQQRRRVCGLAAGDGLFLPAEVADLLDRLREIGVSQRTVQIERDAWILLAGRYREEASRWAAQKLAALADPQLEAVYRAYDQAFDWDPADPRLDELATAIVALTRRYAQEPGEPPPAETLNEPVPVAQLWSQTAVMPPAWLRLEELCREKAEAAS
jgi:DNA-binding transcriptional MerR regulator